MFNPISTYRFQFNKDFTFTDLEKILPYLSELGVSTIYASPITAAVAGSMHGYDVTNPLEINKEIGSVKQLEKIVSDLRNRNMGWLQDIVPNHMAYDMSNPWLYDVLERGSHSDYYNFFDIAWYQLHATSHKKIMAPFLGDDLHACIQQGKIKLGFGENGFFIQYADLRYPVSVDSYSWVCTVLPYFSKPLLPWAKKLEAFSMLPWPQWIQYKKEMMDEVMTDKRSLSFIKKYIDHVNADTRLIAELLSYQHYILACWRVANQHINYRRFFAVNSLICLRMEDENVYDTYHQLIFSLLQKDLIQGLRVDHVDGLYDPGKYIEKLRFSCGPDSYIVVEKILHENETIDRSWPMQGTTGYDFLSFINQLFTDDVGKKELTRFYRNNFPAYAYSDIVFEKKYDFLHQQMNGELDNLVYLLNELGLTTAATGQQKKIRAALAVFISAFPVYRIYPQTFPLHETDKNYVAKAFLKTKQKAEDLLPEIEWLQSLFEPAQDGKDDARLLFIKRVMQFTGPLAAKGTEDTVFYFYNPLISHNEVGDSPGHRPVSIELFHQQMIDRQKNEPYAMNTTSTHDTKRGEDSRMRLNMLSILPDEWIKSVLAWQQLNKKFVTTKDNRRSPTENDEYFIYQALIGGFPSDMHCSEDFVERFKKYITKALREEKSETGWDDPDSTYEKNCFRFIDNILSQENLFLQQFTDFFNKIIERADIFSLAQLLIKLTAPGIPDIYQGSELWDLHFVDPDNRRPVDFGLRRNLLDQLLTEEKKGFDTVMDLINQNKNTGIQKLFVTKKVLTQRKWHPDLFVKGAYIPLQQDNNMIAFLREHENDKALIIAPIPVKGHKGVCNYSFDATHEKLKGKWINQFTGEQIDMRDKTRIPKIFSRFPIAFFTNN